MFIFLHIISVKSVINLLQSSMIQPIVLVGYLGYLCWIYEQICLNKHVLGTELVRM